MLFAGTPQPNPAICFSMMLHAAYAAKLYKERERESFEGRKLSLMV